MFSFDFFLFTICFFIAFPVFSSTDDPIFSECSRPFQCGDSVNIRYPFWGNGRPGYCGHRDLELKCQDNSVVIEIYEQSYHVLDINEQNHTLHVAKTDNFWDNHCPPSFENISLICNIFNCSLPLNQNITLAYGCPLLPDVRSFYQIHCFQNGVPGENYFWVASMGSVPDFSRCNRTIVLPVLRSRAQNLTGMKSTVEEVLKDGFVVGYNVNDSFCNDCEQSGGQCGYQWNKEQPTCFCYNNSSQGTCPPRPALINSSNIRRKLAIGKLAIGFGAGIGSLFLTVIFFVCWKRVTSCENSLTFWRRDKKCQKAVEMFLKNYESLVPRRYHYTEIKSITNSFKNKIGQGGYGGVYKGKLPDGRLVAVKLLNEAKGDGEEFINEVASIGRTNHVNVVNLLGFCFDGQKRALIYEFMANGSLEKFIYDHSLSGAQSHLGWETLYQIAVGVGRGLEYLHRDCNTRILHFDIKPHNILLDKDFTPKISDFGLAKLCPRKESIISMLDLRGTVGYIAPELVSRIFGRVSHKSDVYSYGMMILEMVGRRKNVDVGVDHASEIYFPQWIYKRLVLDQDLGLRGVISDAETEVTRKMILVALWCIQANPTDRPAMSRVVEMLEGKQEQLSIPPKPYLCSPPGSPCVSPIFLSTLTKSL